jgi:hypothetical protein
MPFPMGPMAGAPPPPMASPEMRGGPPTPAARTLMASPLADHMAGGLAPPQNPQLPRIADLVRQGLHAISVMLRDTDPKSAADVEMMGAKLLKIVPTPPPAPGPGGVAGMAGGVPPGGQAMPPPAAPGAGPGGSPLMGL